MKNVCKMVFLIGLFGHSIGEVAISRSPSNGWDSYAVVEHSPAAEYGPPPIPPTTAFPVPANEYGAPPIPTATFEIAQGNVEYDGQVVEVNTPVHQPTFTHFLPPNQFGQLKKTTPTTKIFLPKKNPPLPFHSTTVLNTGEVFVDERQSAKLRQQQQQQQQNHQRPAQFQEIKQFGPALENVYGPPTAVVNPNPLPVAPVPRPLLPPNPPSPPPHETFDPTPFGDNNDDEFEATTDPTVIAVANANGQYGQYYILGKDNTLQRVVYRTERSKDESSINNGFTAHLRYSLVEPIRDPIYGYDDRGHLVRIFNRKK